ncbi:MAG: hypothetical protein ACLUFV_04285 [Acutalibacteraceae bacterium]
MLSAGVLFVYWLVRRRASPFFIEPSVVPPRLRAGGLLSSAALNAFAVVFTCCMYFIYLQYWVMS